MNRIPSRQEAAGAEVFLRVDHHPRPSSSPLPACLKALLLLLLLSFPAAEAEVPPVFVSVPKAKAWVGQRVPFHVGLRARGTFAGTADFDLPQVPGAMVIKIGEPVVGTEEIDGETWFVQRHEFALFSQRTGPLEIPAFPVRFARRDGYTGPASEVQAQAAGLAFEIERPPGSEGIGFLITTESLELTETWEPTPGPAQVGAMFKRTIVQRAPQLPGMALAPAPAGAPDGIRAYPGEAATNDRLARGEFLGERRETITYLLQQPGTLTLPAITYAWWDPAAGKLRSKTLPAATFEVAPPPGAATTGTSAAARHPWPWLLGIALATGMITWQRRRVAAWGRGFRTRLDPPHRVAARSLLRACRDHDAAAAWTAWTAWRDSQPAGFRPGPELRAGLLGLQRHLFGPPPAEAWRGDRIARAFSEHRAAAATRSSGKLASALPVLNPER